MVVTDLTTPKENKKEHEEEAKADEEETAKGEQKASVPLVIHVNNISHSIFYNVEVYINNQQVCNSNGLYEHSSYICNNFKGDSFAYKTILHCEGYYV